jgi:hypothetical protein
MAPARRRRRPFFGPREVGGDLLVRRVHGRGAPGTGGGVQVLVEFEDRLRHPFEENVGVPGPLAKHLGGYLWGMGGRARTKKGGRSPDTLPLQLRYNKGKTYVRTRTRTRTRDENKNKRREQEQVRERE